MALRANLVPQMFHRRRLSLALLALALLVTPSCSSSPGGSAVSDGGGDAGGRRDTVTTEADTPEVPEDVAPQQDTTLGDDVTVVEISTVDLPDNLDSGGCTPGTTACYTATVEQLCNAEGTGVDRRDCADGQFCFGTPGACRPAVCAPDTRECTDGETYRACASDGSGWLGANSCGAGLYCEDGRCLDGSCLPNVLFAFDGSSSMASEWDAIQNSINTVVAANPQVAFGLAMFPTGLGCSIGDGSPVGGRIMEPWPDVDIQANASRRIAQWFETHENAGGATPLVSTLEWFGENAGIVWTGGFDTGYLIVMTEGADTCRCDDDSASCLTPELEAATRALRDIGIRTYVIGYQYSEAPELLNAIARNGGTERTEFVYAGDEASLTDAFSVIVEDVKGCD